MSFCIIDNSNSNRDNPKFIDNDESFNSIFEQKNKSNFSVVSQESSVNSSESNPSNKNYGIWNMIKKEFSDVKNIVTFNIYSNQNKLNITSSPPIRVFNETFNPNNKDQNLLLINKLENIVWFSYRSNFEGIIFNKNVYTSDAGWGCMFRAGQMILAKALCSIYDIKTIEHFMKEKIFLFIDDQILVENLQREQLVGGQDNEKIVFNLIPGFEHFLKTRPQNIKKITPPFSIRSICQMSPSLSKGAGDWFSNYDIIKILTAINNKFYSSSSDIPFEIFNFNEGVFYLNDVIEQCFEKVQCSCVAKSFIDNEITIQKTSAHAFQEEWEVIGNDSKKPECGCYINTFEYNKILYKMKKKFIVFISVRHGLYNLEEDMADAVLSFFDFENNIGILGGKKTRALYFIGKSERELIFLDPHFVQKTQSINDILYGEGQETYKPQDLFHLDVSEISPSFTMGLVCRNLGEFITMLKRLENIPKNKQIKHAFDFKINRLNQFSQQNMGAFQSMNN